ncbi:hypothetical protein ACFQ3B_21335 [Stackebrandtia endophytica]|uniref:hypothetical protein n=1 Tax=Stackebrandtia endophytica TaxID=1496996 RepID=UPI001152A1E6|nr:hypothetical protein [Stackebrandtia endophytica]
MAGQITIPLVAEVYAKAATNTQDAGSHQSDAFGRQVKYLTMDEFVRPVLGFDDGTGVPPYMTQYSGNHEYVGVNRESFGPAYESFNRLRYEMQAMLTQSATNLVETGAAVCTAVAHYAGKDTEVGDILEALQEERLDASDGSVTLPPGNIDIPELPNDPDYYGSKPDETHGTNLEGY